MKKIIITLAVFSLAITAVSAEEFTTTPQTPALYELGKYNFTFENKPKEEIVIPAASSIKTPKSVSTPVNTKTNIQKDIVTPEIKTPEKNLKPINTNINTQKEIVKQIKSDEELITNIKKDTTEQQIEKTYEKVDVTKNKTEKEILDTLQKTEQNIDTTKVNTEKTINKEIRQTQQIIDKKKNKVKKAPNKKSQFSTKQEKPVKYDPDKPPFRFQIKEIRYKDSSTKKTIESL